MFPPPPEEAIGCGNPRIFDHHIHSDGRSADDYELMALSGIDTVLIPCSTSNERRPTGASFDARFDRLLRTETERAARYGVRAWVALSVHAADVVDLPSALAGIEHLAERLDDPAVLAIGELSIRRFTDDELMIFERQLRLAAAAGKPAMVELPPELPEFHLMVEVLRDLFARDVIDPARVAAMDVHPPMVASLTELGCGGLGLPVSPASDLLFAVRKKLNHREVRSLVDDVGPDRLMLNSGFHFGSADPLGLARTVLRLRLDGMDPDTLRGLARDTATAFFGLDDDPTADAGREMVSCVSTR